MQNKLAYNTNGSLIYVDKGSEQSPYSVENICQVYGNSGMNGNPEKDKEIRLDTAKMIVDSVNNHERLLNERDILIDKVCQLYRRLTEIDWKNGKEMFNEQKIFLDQFEKPI